MVSILEISMAYTSIFTTKTKTKPKSSGYVSIFAKPETTVPSDVRTFTMPEHLGGGQFKVGKPGELIKTERGYGDMPAKKQNERDHIISVALGGTSPTKDDMSSRANLQYLHSKYGSKFGDKERQEGKESVEQKAIDDYLDGKIDLNEARAKVAQKQQQIKGLSPTEEEMTVSAGDVAKEAWNIIKSPFIKFTKAFKEEYEERRDKTPEQKEKEYALKNLAGLNGSTMKDIEAKKLEEGTSAVTYEETAEFIEKEEERTEKVSKALTLPVRFTVGYPTQAIISLGTEKAAEKTGVELEYTPKTDAEKLIIGEQKIQRLMKQEDLYGMIARGVGVPAAVTTMAIIENPFLASTGIGAAIKQRIKRLATKEADKMLVRLGAEQLAKIADDAIEAELKAGKISEKQATKARIEVDKMKKQKTEKPPIPKVEKPPIEKVGKSPIISDDIAKAKAEGNIIPTNSTTRLEELKELRKVIDEGGMDDLDGIADGLDKYGLGSVNDLDIEIRNLEKGVTNFKDLPVKGIADDIAKAGNIDKLKAVDTPITKLKSIGDDIKTAKKDISVGKKSMTDLPVLVRKEADGSLTVLDGNHRIAQALDAGKKTIKTTTNEKEYLKISEKLSKPKKPKPIRTIPLDNVDKRKKITTEKIKTTTPKMSKRISNETIEKWLIDDFGDLPEREVIKVKDQAKLVGEIIDKNPKEAIDIALGKKLPKNGALPESVFVAVKNQADKNGDFDLLRKLAIDPEGISAGSSILGARIKMLDEGMKDDAFKRINKLVKDRKKSFEKKGKTVAKAKKAEIKKIKDKIKKPDKHDWNNFVKSIKC